MGAFKGFMSRTSKVRDKKTGELFVEHTYGFLWRRFENWSFLGLAYACLYWARYNLTVFKNAVSDKIMSPPQFGNIFAVGAWVYGLSFLVVGPLVDRVGGRRGMLIGLGGTIAVNLIMGVDLYVVQNWGWPIPLYESFIVLYAMNMFFQAFGAVAIVKVNLPWFHCRERGGFSFIFGALISLGLFLAFDWGEAVVQATRAVQRGELKTMAKVFQSLFGLGGSGTDQNWWVFFAPACGLLVLFALNYLIVRNCPSEAGHHDFNTGSGSLTTDDSAKEGTLATVKKILTHPVLRWVCAIEFCSGVLRNGIMHWFPQHAKAIPAFRDNFLNVTNWGLAQFICGVAGAWFAGWFSDKFFQSRRAPMAAIMYGAMVLALAAMSVFIAGDPVALSISVLVISTAVIGVHGVFSGTITADFAGTKNVGLTVGVVDGLVYLGTGMQSFALGHITPAGALKANPLNWQWWPLFLLPFALLGTFMALKIWNARPPPP